MTDASTLGIKTVLHPVSDLATARAVYASLLGNVAGRSTLTGEHLAPTSAPDRALADESVSLIYAAAATASRTLSRAFTMAGANWVLRPSHS